MPAKTGSLDEARLGKIIRDHSVIHELPEEVCDTHTADPQNLINYLGFTGFYLGRPERVGVGAQHVFGWVCVTQELNIIT